MILFRPKPDLGGFASGGGPTLDFTGLVSFLTGRERLSLPHKQTQVGANVCRAQLLSRDDLVFELTPAERSEDVALLSLSLPV